MSTFSAYFQLGIEHILDLNGFDHLLFIITLVSAYQVNEIKRILILVTAFTIGHSVTLILATTGIFKINSEWIEFLIPVTIFITAIHNIIRGNSARKSMGFAYAIALFFGLIHGMGFSNYLTQLLAGSDVAMPLFAFNVGIEVGQIAIVIAYFILATILFQILRYKQRDWIMVLSGICAGAALVLAKDAVFW